ncbi:hypothetical protein SEVIR_6G203400v4 [Setaria viridis]|uniref:Uncharacterized protein n=2 Tax=Setaria viridis TaxID=4556 RepID=A0A4U6UK65_SETVI|nr:uncharacterized protein LOC117859577 isoform X2 [Setaria viridis]TKW10964.1 hypothetical protein SEVIR_6G203400v2 [Setaria viridis]TKW10972.1 hypothetical protein SEVIR_6G203400v2 [Setaria viridis]TKW10977.1 hypothetical protein SEVIR_6G203400v2 [Setaria viridis]
MSIRICDSSSSNKKKKARKSGKKTRNLWLYNVFEEEFGSLSNSSQGTFSKLSQEVVSNLSETVVSLASFNGDRIHAVCTGIVVKNEGCGTSVLTSATLVRSLDIDNGCKIFPGLMIEVSLPNNRSADGWLVHCDLNYNVAVVNISHYPGFRAAHFAHLIHFGCKVVALGRCFKTGKLKALYGTVNDEPSGDLRKHLMISTCKITMTMAGGPLVDLDGSFVGMNFYSKKMMTPFLPVDTIYKCLVHAGILCAEIKHGGDSTIERSPCEIQEFLMPNVEGSSTGERDKNQELSISSTSYSEDSEEEELWPLLYPNPLPVDDFTELVRNDLKSRNYPMPIRLEGGMRLINTFEEEFVEDTWSKLSKKVASGEERFFACTGIFIGFNESTSRVLTSASLVRTSADEYKIADNLKIKVYLPNKQVAEGTLQRYNLSYNIAVVSVMGFRCLRTAAFNNRQIEPHMEVVAVGRIFESGKLMATSGKVADKEGNLDCKELMISTCKVTKAGIGGPLIDFDGNFIGMNFHGKEETHYLPRSIVLERLRLFERSDVDEASYKKPNRWPVPEPRWSYLRSRVPLPLALVGATYD